MVRLSIYIASIALYALFAIPSIKAGGIHDWTPHLAYHNAIYSIVAEEKIYALYGSNLLEYDRETGETILHSRLTGLCETGIAQIGYEEKLKKLVIVYASGNIDIMDKDSRRVLNMPGLKKISEGDITINNLNVANGEAYISTNNSVVRIGIAEREIIGNYDMKMKVYDATSSNGIIYAACESRIQYCFVGNNPLDPSAWKVFKNVLATKLISFADGLYYQVKPGNNTANNGFWWTTYDTETNKHQDLQLTKEAYTHFYTTEDKVLLANTYKCAFYTKENPTKVTQWAQQNAWNGLSCTSDNMYWASEGADGLVEYQFDETSKQLIATGSNVGCYGPKRDFCYYSTFIDGRLLVTGGLLDHTDLLHHPGTIMQYDGEWTAFGETGFRYEERYKTRGDVTSVVQDPNDPNHHFASCAGLGVLEFRDYKIVADYNIDNSSLGTAAPGIPYYVRVDGLNFDRDGNLWMLNCAQDSVIKVRKKNGEWISLFAKGLEQAPTLEKSLFDSKGRFWACSRYTMSMHTSGLYCLYYGGSLDNVDSDTQIFRSSASNQDGKACNLEYVHSIAEDKNGEIWFGTASGLYVITDPEEWKDNNAHVTQIKVPRNDGTNYADYLLAGVGVKAIAVDGANRKWLGTEESGLYLVSPDGTQILEHFTMENSPLLSNNILSLSVDPNTGEVYIGTANGMISYNSGITEPEPTLKENNVKVYPNPVRPEHHSGVTITGLTDGAEVKITTIGGQVVASGYSTGGTFIWDCLGSNGDRVATGVYLILATTSKGKDGIVAKVVVI